MLLQTGPCVSSEQLMKLLSFLFVLSVFHPVAFAGKCENVFLERSVSKSPELSTMDTIRRDYMQKLEAILLEDVLDSPQKVEARFPERSPMDKILSEMRMSNILRDSEINHGIQERIIKLQSNTLNQMLKVQSENYITKSEKDTDFSTAILSEALLTLKSLKKVGHAELEAVRVNPLTIKRVRAEIEGAEISFATRKHLFSKHMEEFLKFLLRRESKYPEIEIDIEGVAIDLAISLGAVSLTDVAARKRMTRKIQNYTPDKSEMKRYLGTLDIELKNAILHIINKKHKRWESKTDELNHVLSNLKMETINPRGFDIGVSRYVGERFYDWDMSVRHRVDEWYDIKLNVIESLEFVIREVSSKNWNWRSDSDIFYDAFSVFDVKKTPELERVQSTTRQLKEAISVRNEALRTQPKKMFFNFKLLGLEGEVKSLQQSLRSQLMRFLL